jgi:hypothetical protein
MSEFTFTDEDFLLWPFFPVSAGPRCQRPIGRQDRDNILCRLSHQVAALDRRIELLETPLPWLNNTQKECVALAAEMRRVRECVFTCIRGLQP